jgi:hypothetical protein
LRSFMLTSLCIAKYFKTRRMSSVLPVCAGKDEPRHPVPVRHPSVSRLVLGAYFLCENRLAMDLLHDSQYRSTIANRLRSLRADSRGRWGKMSVDQMLWHVNQGLALSLGEVTAPPQKVPLPRPILKFFVLNLPWPKGAPTLPQAEAKQQYDFDAERARCFHLLEAFARKPLDEVWPVDPVFGKVTGRFKSRLQAKHLNHHLRQFGA